jgi:RND family efflux transporter MFP subunit
MNGVASFSSDAEPTPAAQAAHRGTDAFDELMIIFGDPSMCVRRIARFTVAGLLMLAGSGITATDTQAQTKLSPRDFLQDGFGRPELGEDTSPVDGIRAENCTVKFIRKTNIPAEVEGKLTELLIEEGDDVSSGDLIAVIDDTQAKLAVELKLAEEKEALLNATNDVNLKDAKNSESLAKAEAKSFEELFDQNAIPYYEWQKKVLEAVRATLRIELAEMQMKIASVQYKAKESERRMADHQLTKHQLKADFGGFIEKRIAQPGEWVQPGSPIATLVQLDKLRVEGDIDALRYRDHLYKGAPVQVLVYNGAPDGKPVSVESKIGFISSEIDLRDRVRVWVEVDNRRDGETWLIKPGMKAEIVLR